MDFLNQREGGKVFYFFFTVYSSCTVETVWGCMSLKKQKSQDKAVEVTVNSKAENS